MTDEELIEALWKGKVTLSVVASAAVRIQELVKERDTWQKEALRQNGLMHNVMLGAAKAEDKLVKAVEALRNIAHGGGYTDMQIARAVLAELEKSE